MAAKDNGVEIKNDVIPLAEQIRHVEQTLAKMAIAAPQNDLALAIGIVPAVEKALRKLKNSWTAELVRASAQQTLKL